MRYNFNDTWSVIFDDNCKPLRGKIEFCEANTTDLKPIYSVDNYELPNPIYCNERPTYQIIVDEGDYTVRYYRYIGNGNMESDHSESSWLLYKTENLHNESVSSTQASKVTTVDNVTGLMNIEGMEPGDIAHVLGYDDVDDGCPDRYFVWHSENKEPDGGIIFNSLRTTAGHWRMVIPGSYIDVRWFGDIPDTSATPTQQTSNLGQRAKAAAAAREYGKDLYFPHSNKSETYGYYLFDGSNTVSIDGDIYCDNGVRFVVKDGTTGTSVACSQLHKVEKHLFVRPTQGTGVPGTFSLVSDWVNTSWLTSNETSGHARYGYVIDELKSTLNFSNTKLKVMTSLPDNIVLDNVEIEGERFVEKGNHIQVGHMTLDSDWFVDGYDYSYVRPLAGLKIDVTKCDTADNYILLKNLISEYDYGDLREMELHDAKVNAPGLLENCSGSVEIVGHGNFELHNASIKIKGANSSDSITSLDSWLTFDNTSVVGNLTLHRGSLSGNFQILNALDIRDAEIYSTLSLMGLGMLDVIRCKISGILNIVGHENYNILSNVFQSGSAVTHVFDANVGNGTYDGNIIEAGSEGWAFSSNVANTVVNVSWTNNTSFMTSHFISLDRTNFAEDDILHGYVYKNNNGRFAIKDTTEMEVIGYFSSKQNPPADTLAVIRKGDASVTYWEANVLNWWNNTSNGKVINPTMFIVGKKADVIVDFQCYPSTVYPSRLTIHGNNFVIDTRKAVIGVTWNTANSFKLDTGTYRSIFIINGTGDADYDMMSDTNTRWILKLETVR